MPPIRPELLDELLKDYKKPDDLLGQDGLLQQLTKALVERALDGELTHHLGYEKHDSAGDNSGNSRNGTTPEDPTWQARPSADRRAERPRRRVRAATR
jgi:transposase-like protein